MSASGIAGGRKPLADHIAIVTGASAGLGRDFARILADQGAAVLAVARRESELASLSDEIRAAGGHAAIHVADLTNPAQIAPLFEAAERLFGGVVDILINNAGTVDGDFAVRLDRDTIDRLINLNFRAPFLCATEAARRLIAARKPGRIVNIASIYAKTYAPGSSAALYSATKGGIVRMTEVLAIEWARFGINVNAIAPGVFASEMTAAMLERIGPDLAASFPRRRLGKPENLRSTLLYLVDPASTHVTGTCILVDDGQMPR